MLHRAYGKSPACRIARPSYDTVAGAGMILCGACGDIKRYRTPCLVLVVVLMHIFYGSHMRTRDACGTVSFECGGSTVLYKDTDTALVRH